MVEPTTPGFTVGSFRIEQEHEIAAPCDIVFAFLTNKRDPCWLTIFAGHGGTMRIDPRPGGAIGEFWDDGFFLWGTVTEVETDRALAWTGPNGMHGAVFGTTRITLAPGNETAATVLSLSHHVFGEVTTADERRYGEDGGWSRLVEQLRHLAESARAA